MKRTGNRPIPLPQLHSAFASIDFEGNGLENQVELSEKELDNEIRKYESATGTFDINKPIRRIIKEKIPLRFCLLVSH